MKKLLPAFMLALVGCPYGHYSTDESVAFTEHLGKYKSALVVVTADQAEAIEVGERFQQKLAAELVRLAVFQTVLTQADQAGPEVKVAGALSSPHKTVNVTITVTDLKSGNILGEFRVEGKSSLYSGKDYGVDKTAVKAADYLAKQR